jgi:hypothetical protein
VESTERVIAAVADASDITDAEIGGGTPRWPCFELSSSSNFVPYDGSARECHVLSPASQNEIE